MYIYIIYTFVYYTILQYMCIRFVVTSPDAPEIHTYIEISLEHLMFQAVLHRFWSRRNCDCGDKKFLNFSRHFVSKRTVQISYVNPQSWISHFGFLSSSAMERREDGRQRMLGSLPWIDSQFVGLCAEL